MAEHTVTGHPPDVDWDLQLAHDPDPEEVMAILVRQVEHALRTVPRAEVFRLRSEDLKGWVA